MPSSIERMVPDVAREREAWVISIGNELLIGKVVNTNFSWLAEKLTSIGYHVRREITVMDDIHEISWAIREALSSGASLIISTGGLGPTYDDKTSEALAFALSRSWEVNEKALVMVKRKYESAGMELTESRVKMAKLPRGALPLENPAGTAPGIMVREGRTIIVALPGVPKEMKAIFNNILEDIKAGIKVKVVESEFLVLGVPESSIAPLIEEVVSKYPQVYVKSHPMGRELGAPLLLIHLSAEATEEKDAISVLKEAEDMLRSLIRDLGGEIRENKNLADQLNE